MKTASYSQYARPIGVEALSELATLGHRLFDTRTFATIAAKQGLSSASAHLVLHELTRARWIERVRRGLYVIRAPEFSAGAVHPFAVATHLVTPSAIAGWSALHHHGFTDQVPHIVSAITPKKVQPPSMRSARDNASSGHTWEILGVRVTFSTVSPRRFTGIEEVWLNEYDRAPITDRERTVFDLFLSPGKYGGITEGLGVLKQHGSQLSISRLVSYALEIQTISAAKRLGWTLEQSKMAPRAIASLQKMPTGSWHLLDPLGPPSGPLIPRWNLRVNI